MNFLIKKFRNFSALKESRLLALEVYKITENFPREEPYGIAGQLRKAANSVKENIAEGLAERYIRDKIKFYYSARRSIIEVQYFLSLAKNLGYIDGFKKCKDLDKRVSEAKEMIDNLIKLVENQEGAINKRDNK